MKITDIISKGGFFYRLKVSNDSEETFLRENYGECYNFLWHRHLEIVKEVFYLIKKVEICGVNTSKLPVLSNEEKNELFEKIKQGDENAREEFINRKFKISFKCYTKIWK